MGDNSVGTHLDIVTVAVRGMNWMGVDFVQEWQRVSTRPIPFI